MKTLREKFLKLYTVVQTSSQTMLHNWPTCKMSHVAETVKIINFALQFSGFKIKTLLELRVNLFLESVFETLSCIALKAKTMGHIVSGVQSMFDCASSVMIKYIDARDISQVIHCILFPSDNDPDFIINHVPLKQDVNTSQLNVLSHHNECPMSYSYIQEISCQWSFL